MSHRGHRESMNGKIEALCRKGIGNRDSKIDGERGDLRSRDDESVIFAKREKASSKSGKI